MMVFGAKNKEVERANQIHATTIKKYPWTISVLLFFRIIRFSLILYIVTDIITLYFQKSKKNQRAVSSFLYSFGIYMR